MSAFEFVLVAFSIIIGFGVSEILASWGQQIRARDRLAPFPLQIAATALVLIVHLSFLWGLWMSRGIEWTFPLYLLFAAMACVLGLCAHVMTVDTTPGAEGLREQYFRNSRPAYALFALVPLLVVAFTFTSGVSPGGTAYNLLRIFVSGLLASLAWFRNERYHWVGLAILWLIILGAMGSLAFRLGEDAA